MNIAIVAPFCSLPNEAYFNRFLYLAEHLAQQHSVWLYTSDFRHHDKTFRTTAAIHPNPNIHIRLIHERGYTRNVSWQRVVSHRVFARHLEQEVRTWQVGQFDVVYSAYPLIGSNLVLGKYKKSKQFKLIIDIQDIWPESFTAVVPCLHHIPVQYLPFAQQANRAYRYADGMVAVSQTYLQRGLSVNPACRAYSKVVYIGADAQRIQRISPTTRRPARHQLFYLGTLSHSYDIATVCQAVQQLINQQYDIEFHIIGGGGDEQTLRNFQQERIIFHGYLPYEQMIALAKSCDIAVNAIHQHAPQSITNKLSDYVLLGKAILNSQTQAEARQIIEQMPHAHYQSGNINSCVTAIKQLLHQTPSTPSNEWQARFDRNQSYPEIAQLIEQVANMA